MLDFKPIKIEDVCFLKKHLSSPTRFSCETNIVNLIVWQKMYGNMYAFYNNMLFIKSGESNNESYRLPFGDNLEKGIAVLRKHTKCDYPPLWVQQGERFIDFNLKYGADYELIPERDAFDYIYLQEDLAFLRGKKYHGKRNHIAAFSKRCAWHFEKITQKNISDVLECAEEWYAQNSERFDEYMQCEKNGIRLILENMDLLDVSGGAIYTDGKVVAFTLGSPINRDVFDIHIEKALPEYAEAYTVINNEFAKTLSEFKYINREDDLGLLGLRKAKLSYKPHIILKKYLAVSKKERAKQIYHSAFAEEDNTFENMLFEKYYKYCRRLEKDGRTVSLCFAFPCKIGTEEAEYIYALTTAPEFRGNGYANELIKNIKAQGNKLLILRPSDQSLIEFYEKTGFLKFKATNKPTNGLSVEPANDYKDLAIKYKENSGEYTAMYLGTPKEDLNNLYFPYSMP